MHNPAATLKNIRQNRIGMYFMIRWFISSCSLVGGGVISFCWNMKNTATITGSRLKYGPRYRKLKNPHSSVAGWEMTGSHSQLNSMSGAARFVIHKNGDSRKWMLSCRQ